MGRYLVCVTGASGSRYGARTIEALIKAGHEVHAVFSTWGESVFIMETGWPAQIWMLTASTPRTTWQRLHPQAHGNWTERS